MKKLSRSKIELLEECPRCFWLDVVQGIKRPPPAPYTINNAIDYLLKQEFDLYRERGAPHPIMEENHVEAIPYDAPEMNKWRHNFTGVQFEDAENDFLLFGAVDDIWINPQGELIVVDYKATGAKEHHIYDSYGRQMEIYQWLLRKNGYKVSDFGYFVFAKVDKGDGFSKNGGSSANTGSLPFDLIVEAYKGDDAWVESRVKKAREVCEMKKSPSPSEGCAYCEYRRAAGEVLVSPDLIKG